MCLAVPGKIVEVRDENEAGVRLAKVDFQGSRVAASLVFTPEAGVGDWVLVHAGFAIRRLDEADALETWKYLEADDTDDLRKASGAAIRDRPGADGNPREEGPRWESRSSVLESRSSVLESRSRGART